jgi:hypothetical protein
MLIILSGVDTIGKSAISKNIVKNLNTFVVDGYDVKFDVEPFQVINTSTGDIVYSPSSSDDSTRPPQETFDKILSLEQTVFDSILPKQNYRNTFVDILSDYEITNDPTYGNIADNLKQTQTYQDLIDSYNSRIYENFVISGSFSKVFIDKISNDLGKDNVTVYNIIRNPSVSVFLQQQTSDYYTKTHPDTITPEVDFEKLKQSIVNSVSISRDNTVHTLKYEDILQEGSFTVLGTKVPLLVGPLFNSYITEEEYEYATSINSVNEDNILSFNQTMSNWGSTTRLGHPDLPSNIFDLLGYTAMTRSQIISK